jgi:hypothetical protein
MYRISPCSDLAWSVKHEGKVHELHLSCSMMTLLKTNKLHRTMLKYILTLLTVLLFCAISASAETLHLSNGELLEGKIRIMDEKTLFLESNLTAQELKIDRADLNLIEFDTSGRSLARRIGIGFHYRPNGNEENLSVKNWLSKIDSAELMVGYSSGSVNTFNVELRYARVFKVESTSDIFYGAGTGIISKEGKRGTAFRFFSGSEFFPRSSPNFGISLELGVLRKQGVGDDTQGFYNAISARYYF